MSDYNVKTCRSCGTESRFWSVCPWCKRLDRRVRNLETTQLTPAQIVLNEEYRNRGGDKDGK